MSYFSNKLSIIFEDEFDFLDTDAPVEHGDDMFGEEGWKQFKVTAYVISPKHDWFKVHLEEIMSEWVDNLIYEVGKRYDHEEFEQGPIDTDNINITTIDDEINAIFAKEKGIVLPPDYEISEFLWTGGTYCEDGYDGALGEWDWSGPWQHIGTFPGEERRCSVMLTKCDIKTWKYEDEQYPGGPGN